MKATSLNQMIALLTESLLGLVDNSIQICIKNQFLLSKDKIIILKLLMNTKYRYNDKN